jgi:uncharacterized Zn finger protein
MTGQPPTPIPPTSSKTMNYDWYYPPYVTVAQRRAKAAKAAAKLAKRGRAFQPVVIQGRQIAHTFWGQAWCRHLESFSDYENRLPRGRAYARHGAVIDLKMTRGKIAAQIMGSRLYEATLTVRPLAPARWQAIKRECSGKIDSLVELLQGRLSDAVMQVITHRDEGLFPKPDEISLDCSCPDWAALCKHLAAVLYGVGARLDTQPELLFLLRGVDHLELLEQAAAAGAQAATNAGAAGLAEADLAEVFNIEIASAASPLATSRVPASVLFLGKKYRKGFVKISRVGGQPQRPLPAKTPAPSRSPARRSKKLK